MVLLSHAELLNRKIRPFLILVNDIIVARKEVLSENLLILKEKMEMEKFLAVKTILPIEIVLRHSDIIGKIHAQ